MSNLSSSSHFSKPFFQAKSIENTEKTEEILSGKFLSGYRKLFTPLAAYRFVTESTYIGDTKLNRSELLYLLLVIGSYSPEYPLFSEKQENYYPESLKIRKLYRCETSQNASKADKLRMYFVDRGLLEVIETKGNISNKAKLSKKFFFYFCLHMLVKDRTKTLKETEHRRITEEDFLKRFEIEEKITFLEQELQEKKLKHRTVQEKKNSKLT